MTWASTSRARSQRASQKPSRPASKAIAIRSILCPAFSASSRQRLSSFSNALSSAASFFNGERSTPGTIPATSQLDWPISITAISVASCSRITRDLLKSFSCGMGRSVDSLERRWCHCPRRSPHSIFFGAFHALAIDDGSGGTGLSFVLLPTFHIKRVVDTIQRAVVAPQVEIIKQRAARWQVLRDCTPLASRAQNIHDPVHHFAHVDVALVAAALGWRDQQFDMRPFIVGQITRISQFAAVVTPAILRRPHRCPPNQVTTLESQTIHMTQDDFGQTLSMPRRFMMSLSPLRDRPPTASSLPVPPETSTRPAGSSQKNLQRVPASPEGHVAIFFCRALGSSWPISEATADGRGDG